MILEFAAFGFLLSQPLIDAATASRWSLRSGDGCALVVQLPEVQSSIEIITPPGGADVNVITDVVRWHRRYARGDGLAHLTVWPQGAEFTGLAVPQSAQGRGQERLGVFQLPPEFLKAVSAGSGLRITLADGSSRDLVLKDLATAVDALVSCDDHLLRSLGVDVEALRGLLRMPTPVGGGGIGQWVRSWDYPPEVLRRGGTGTVIMRLTIDANGRVNNCEVAASSGHGLLDQTSCAILSTRGRYEPALSQDGRPVEVTTVATLSWRLSQ